nr:VOC family protein [Burkholderia sp. RF2-non_BP3]
MCTWTGSACGARSAATAAATRADRRWRASKRVTGTPAASGGRVTGLHAGRDRLSCAHAHPRAPSRGPAMNVQLNHTIVWCRDKHASSRFLTELLELPAPTPFGAMLVVQLDNGVSLDFYEKEGEITAQHYAFLTDEAGFDRVFARIRERGLPHWADPAKRQPGDIYRHNGGRGVYFDDPDGHFLEVMTQPYVLNG